MYVPVPKCNTENNYCKKQDELFNLLHPPGTKLHQVVNHIFDEKGNKLNLDKLLLEVTKHIWEKR